MADNLNSGEEPQDDQRPAEPSKRSVAYQKVVADLRKEVAHLRKEVADDVADLSKEVRSNKSSWLETGQHVATIIGVPIGVLAMVSTFLAFVAAAYSFTYTGEMQAEDAANRAIQEHMNLRANLDEEDMSEWLLTLRDSPEQMDDSSQVPNAVFTQYDSVADHGIATVEWIYRTRVTRKPVEGLRPFEYALSGLGLRETEKDEGWESAVRGWIWEYRAAIYARDRAYEDEGAEEYSNFGCRDYSPNFVRLVRRTLADRELEEGHIERAVSVWANLCPDIEA